MSLDPDTLDTLLDAIAEKVADKLHERAAHGLDPARAHENGSGEWRLYSVEEIAAVLGRSPRWIHDACARRGLPYVRLDRRGKRFDPDDVAEWARSRRVPEGR